MLYTKVECSQNGKDKRRYHSGKTSVACNNGVYSKKKLPKKHKKTISIDLIVPISTAREMKHQKELELCSRCEIKLLQLKINLFSPLYKSFSGVSMNLRDEKKA